MIKIIKKIAVGKLDQEFFNNNKWIIKDPDGNSTELNYLYNEFEGKLVKITIEDIGNGKD